MCYRAAFSRCQRLFLLLWQNCLSDNRKNERQTITTQSLNAVYLSFEILKIVLCVAFGWHISMILLYVKLGTNMKQTQLEWSCVNRYHSKTELWKWNAFRVWLCTKRKIKFHVQMANCLLLLIKILSIRMVLNSICYG